MPFRFAVSARWLPSVYPTHAPHLPPTHYTHYARTHTHHTTPLRTLVRGHRSLFGLYRGWDASPYGFDFGLHRSFTFTNVGPHQFVFIAPLVGLRINISAAFILTRFAFLHLPPCTSRITHFNPTVVIHSVVLFPFHCTTHHTHDEQSFDFRFRLRHLRCWH